MRKLEQVQLQALPGALYKGEGTRLFPPSSHSPVKAVEESGSARRESVSLRIGENVAAFGSRQPQPLRLHQEDHRRVHMVSHPQPHPRLFSLKKNASYTSFLLRVSVSGSGSRTLSGCRSFVISRTLFGVCVCKKSRRSCFLLVWRLLVVRLVSSHVNACSFTLFEVLRFLTLLFLPFSFMKFKHGSGVFPLLC